MVDRELDESARGERRSRSSSEIDDALERIDAGDVRPCTAAAAPIPEERLDAVPYATLCVACKRDEERRERAGA